MNLNDWYEPDDHILTCPQCEEQEDALNRAQKAVRRLLPQLYSGIVFNAKLCEDEVQELCYVLGVPFPEEEIQITRKE